MHLVNVFFWIVLLLITLCGLEIFIQHCQQESRHRALVVRLMLARKVSVNPKIGQNVCAAREENRNNHMAANGLNHGNHFYEIRMNDNMIGNQTFEYSLPSRGMSGENANTEKMPATERINCA